MKLIVDIYEEQYEFIKQGMPIEKVMQFPALMEAICEHIANGTPLDEIKAEIEKQIERDFAFAETETLKVPCHYGTANGLQVAVRIIDNVGKTESEE